MSSSPAALARLLLSLLPLTLLGACAGVRGGDYRVYDAAAAAPVELVDSVDALAQADVVFLGEEHDNDVGHELQLLTIRLLHRQRPDMALSMEQFEADVQDVLDAYLAGRLSEAEFLARARPWGNYAEHYRPIVEWAREEGVPVIAANIPRSLAARVARNGLWNVAGEELTPWTVQVDEPAYQERFTEAMGGHGAMDEQRLARFYAAQCLKDETMAQRIADAISPERTPFVVHLCGKFHSDFRLGTVSRLARRRPDLAIAVVTQSSGDGLARALDADERGAADFVWRVPAMER